MCNALGWSREAHTVHDKHICIRPPPRFDWKGNTPDNLKTNWIKGGKMTITRIYADKKTGKFDL